MGTVHGHGHEHDHEHGHPDHTVILEQQVLAKNDGIAVHNRQWMRSRRITALNIMSSPGAGKTTLLARTIRELGCQRPIAVIEGDQETRLDAERIRETGASVVQVNTGAGCHLDAAMIDRALRALDPAEESLLLIENVGNLVCPALFDLGEEGKVVLISTPEGADKPKKVPTHLRCRGPRGDQQDRLAPVRRVRRRCLRRAGENTQSCCARCCFVCHNR